MADYSNRIRFIITILVLLVLVGCEKSVDWKIKHDNQKRLVVDGILTNEAKSQLIKLTYSYQDLNAEPRPFSGAIVMVTDSSNNYQFTENQAQPGIYQSDPFIAVVGRKYYLTIQTDTAIFHATAYAVPVTPLKNIMLEYDSTAKLYSQINIEDSKPSMTENNYDWTNDLSYCSKYGNCQAAETFYSLNNLDISEAFGPEKQKIQFPKGTVIYRKKYSLTNEHQEFIRSLLIETDWRGGMFDVQQGNVLTNISNGALGYFAVCMVVSDTTRVK